MKYYSNNGLEKQQAQRERFYEKKLWVSARNRAKLKDLEFTITISDILIPERCPYLDCVLSKTQGKGRLPTNASLDRIDPKIGYTKTNIQVISDLANKMKSNATLAELISFAEGVQRVHGKNPP